MSQDCQWRIGRRQHDGRPVAKEANVSVVINQMPRLVTVCILETVFSRSHVGRFADVTAVKLQSWSEDKHFTPVGEVSVLR